MIPNCSTLVRALPGLFLSLLSFDLAFSQLDWERAVLDISVMPEEERVEGTVTYTLVTSDKWDSIRMDSRSIDIRGIEYAGEQLEFTSGERYLTIYPKGKKWRKGQRAELTINFSAQPEKAFYFRGWNDPVEGNEQFWTQGQGKHHSHWFPGFDRTDLKMEFDLKVRLRQDLPVISNGVLEQKTREGEMYIWEFDMDQPMATYLLAVAVGDFDYREGVSTSGIPQKWYFPRGTADRFEPTYRYSVEIFDWLESYLGVAYPWEKYEQVPVRDFMYGGMENTGATFFNPSYLIDSLAYEDSNYVSTNAHELAHQWFGNLITERGPEDHWLHEGFATFIGSKAEIRFNGSKKGYWELYNNARILEQLAKEGNLQALTDPEAGTETFYQKGAWALFILEDLMGEEGMQKCLRKFLEKYAFDNATVKDFLTIAGEFSPVDLRAFREEWIYSADFPIDQALDYLRRKEPEVAMFLDLDRAPLSPADTAVVEEALKSALNTPGISFGFALNLLGRARENDMLDLIYEGLNSPRREVRKAAILTLEQVPAVHAEALWKMADDPSYLSGERVLWNLWNAGPDEQVRVLDHFDGRIGFPNRSLRSLWLTLALATDGYREDEKESLFAELKSYSSSLYDFPVREYAFQYLSLLGAIDQEVIDYLVNACVHPYTEFRDSSREMLEELLKNPAVGSYLKLNLERYTGSEQRFLNTLID